MFVYSVKTLINNPFFEAALSTLDRKVILQVDQCTSRRSDLVLEYSTATAVCRLGPGILDGASTQ
jgi:hypothetical protein